MPLAPPRRDPLPRRRAEGSDATCAEILARAAASGIALASEERPWSGED